jgi:hypothetical protein
MLSRDGHTAARFYVRFGITEAQFRQGVPSDGTETDEAPSDRVQSLCDGIAEVRARAQAAAPA